MYNATLLPGNYYHIYNHAVGNECLFRQADNYLFFLERYGNYLFPVVRTYAYCLMPNHFHVLVQIRNEDELMDYFMRVKNLQIVPLTEVDFSAFVMQQFSNFFNSYAKAFNRRFDRKGALFLNYMRRKAVESENYFTTLLAYIHNNPVHHGFCLSPNDWAYSSLNSIISKKPTRLERSVIMDWFGGIESYIAFHKENHAIPLGEDWEFGY